ncbi:MAG TPA: hypothetical protein VET29_13365, partial [Actinophytocola sp.]
MAHTITGTAGRCVQPEPTPLKRIHRHINPRPTTNKARPVNGSATNPSLREGSGHPRHAAVITTQGAHDNRIRTYRVDTFLDAHRQNRMRTHLNENRKTSLQQILRSLTKQHPLTQVPEPIPTVQTRSIKPPTRHRRKERHLRRTRLNIPQHLNNRLLQHINLARMRRVIHWHPPNANPTTLTLPHHTLQPHHITRQHRRRRTIHRGNTNTPNPTQQSLN